MRFIKNQVLDLADQFDTMTQLQSKQTYMISYLVNTIQKLESEGLRATEAVNQIRETTFKDVPTR